MNKYFENLADELEFRLQQIQAEGEGLAGLYESIELTKKTLLALKAYVLEHRFESLEAEVHYYKVVAPPLYARLFAFHKRYDVQMAKRHSSKEKYEEDLRFELARIEQFNKRHPEFCLYYEQNGKYMDDRIFVRNAKENGMLDAIEMIMGEDFCVGSYWAAQLLANIELRVWLEKQIYLLGQPEAVMDEFVSKLECKKGVTAIVELISAQHEAGWFGDWTLTAAMKWAEKIYNVKLGNFHDTRQSIARRKTERTKNVSKLVEALERVLDKLGQ